MKSTRKSRGKLNEEAIRFIRRSVMTDGALALKYGVHRTAINHVRKGRTWASIQ